MFATRTLSKMIASRAQIQMKSSSIAKKMLMQPAMMNMGMVNYQTRLFASFDTIEKASQKLNKALDSELKYENENYTQLEDIETFLNESGFVFSETDGGLHMKLTKEVGDKKVEIRFEAR